MDNPNIPSQPKPVRQRQVELLTDRIGSLTARLATLDVVVMELQDQVAQRDNVIAELQKIVDEQAERLAEAMTLAERMSVATHNGSAETLPPRDVQPV